MTQQILAGIQRELGDEQVASARLLPSANGAGPAANGAAPAEADAAEDEEAERVEAAAEAGAKA